MHISKDIIVIQNSHFRHARKDTRLPEGMVSKLYDLESTSGLHSQRLAAKRNEAERSESRRRQSDTHDNLNHTNV